jgi:hypothetical protein
MLAPDHAPLPSEQVKLDSLLEHFAFEAVTIRLTDTMLEKSIIDAGRGLRALLGQDGWVDFAVMPQGREYGIELELPVVSSHGTELRTVSFYRPPTKKGDPRFWISLLNRRAAAGDLLAMLFAGERLVAVNLGAPIHVLLASVRELLPPRLDAFRDVQQTISRLRERIEEIRRAGWIKTMRGGDTGIGFTLETLLGIQANSSRAPDVDGVELKSRRVGDGRSSNKLVTLFSKTPSWGNIDKGRGLLELCGRHSEKDNRWSLYCTTSTQLNSFGLALVIEPDERRVNVEHKGQPTVFYDFGTLNRCLHEKHTDTLFISARTRGSGREEEFQFEQAVYCSQPSFSRFLDLTAEDAISLDFTLSQKPTGAARDHGYLWRIRERKLDSLFAYQRALL